MDDELRGQRVIGRSQPRESADPPPLLEGSGAHGEVERSSSARRAEGDIEADVRRGHGGAVGAAAARG